MCRFVDEFILPGEIAAVLPKVTPEAVSPHNPTAVELLPEHVIVHDFTLNYGSKVRALQGLSGKRAALTLSCCPSPRTRIQWTPRASFVTTPAPSPFTSPSTACPTSCLTGYAGCVFSSLPPAPPCPTILSSRRGCL